MRNGDGMVVGSIGFFGAPIAVDDVDETEVGFGLVEDARGHGAVTEALIALLEHTDRAGVRIRASVQPENRASLRVLAKCGFTQLRGSTEDGELVMVRPLPASSVVGAAPAASGTGPTPGFRDARLGVRSEVHPALGAGLWSVVVLLRVAVHAGHRAGRKGAAHLLQL